MNRSLLVFLFLGLAVALFGTPKETGFPNLLDIKDISELDDSWTFLKSIKYDTGRFIIGKLGGSLWSKKTFTDAANEWTTEFIFRSSGTNSDLMFSESNGLSLFIVQDPNLEDFSNFGGPRKFDGFQFLLNNRGKQGLKIYSNDGTKLIENDLDEAVADCEFPYINSQVPFNIRISYSKGKTFKVQVDNNLCFQTDKIAFPDGKYTLGVAGNISPASEEFFEVFKLQVWDHLTEDAIDDHGLMADGELKVVVEKQVVPEEKVFHPPSAVRQSLLEKTRKHKEELERKLQLQEQEQKAPEDKPTFEGIQIDQILIQNEDLKAQLSDIHSTLRALKNSDSQSERHSESLAQQIEAFNEFRTTISNQYVELLESISKLNSKLIGEVREQQFTIDELSKKVELLMNNHKELQYQSSNSGSTDSSSVIRWALITIVVVLLFLAVFVYRLRHDFKHAKLL